MTVLIEKKDCIFTVIINRPETKNAVDGPTAAALAEALMNEFHRGMEPIKKGEALQGAAKFTKGVGKHGEF